MESLKFLPTIVVKLVLRFFYYLFCSFTKVDDLKVTFASYRSDTLKDNLFYMNKEMEENYPEYNRNFLFKKFDSSVTGKISYIFHMIKACYYIATSKYFIIDDYYFPIYVLNIRNDVEVIQVWHSAGALKKFGLSTVGKPFGPSETYLKHVSVHGNYSKVYVSCAEVIPYYAEAFQMPEERIYPLGIPRTDYFFSKENQVILKEKFYQSFPELDQKKVLLYAPTFRGKSHYQNNFQLPFYLEKMGEELQNDYVLFIHLHPYMHNQFQAKSGKFVYVMNDSYSIQELLVLADILITDYSTVFFDYSLLEKPMIFYPYDLEEYKKERDFYYSYEELIPGPMVKDTESLIKEIKEGKFDLNRIRKFKNRFFDIQDGKATERIMKHILGKESLELLLYAEFHRY